MRAEPCLVYIIQLPIPIYLLHLSLPRALTVRRVLISLLHETKRVAINSQIPRFSK
jgi:hypothetical protein